MKTKDVPGEITVGELPQLVQAIKSRGMEAYIEGCGDGTIRIVAVEKDGI